MLRIRPTYEFAAIKAQMSFLLGIRTFGSGNMLGIKQMPPRPPPIDESEFTEVFLCGSGPGGQKIVSLLY